MLKHHVQCYLKVHEIEIFFGFDFEICYVKKLKFSKKKF
jgi:hypothetical protein